jgi:polycomb group RING finger protein 4
MTHVTDVTCRSDRILQTLAYKLVPGLYQTEMQRRREFSSVSGTTCDLQADSSFFSPEDSISLSLEYYDRLVVG